jgi:aspartate oxidase
MLELDIGRLLYLRLLVSKQIIKSALENEESLGAHILID